MSDSQPDPDLAGAGLSATGKTADQFSPGDDGPGTTYGERLFVLEKESGTCVASEPYDDDPDWFEVPEGVLVEGNEHGLTLTPLEL